ncbi:hypothetical protein ACFFJY_09245 [Fictibacillus aquaticus]|uniref:Uncharacterized protein n=1 Tax=Fictibacillus aquaticus TaxID=2021314 RepID=A0A235FAU5_9BACL|nr:hypothetical protein [Fictibacillus aquaticus]OYD58461.1 hypothetical protein CGZ90_00740 [Fictibacillus aquaticus]
MSAKWLDNHIAEIKKCQAQLNEVAEENHVHRISVLSRMLIFIGKVSAELSEEYKKIYARRKQVHAEAYIAATKNKAAEAELAVVQLRLDEAEAYGSMKRWNNAFESTKEEINALKYKVKVNIEDGSNRG